MSLSAQDLVLRVKEISSLPDFFMRLDELINSPTVSFKQIGDILSEDAGISLRLLRLANSALFNFPRKIETIQAAISVIGTQQLRDLVLATTIMDMFSSVKNDIVSMRSFWEHSIACGITARVLATYLRDPNVERFYLMGLLHDIGRLIFFSQLAEKSRQALEMAKEKNIFLYKAEHQIFGFDHAHLGRVLLKQWRLVDCQQDAVSFHHTPHRAQKFKLEAAVVHISDIIVNAYQLGSSGERWVPALEVGAWDLLNISEKQLPQIVMQIQKQYEVALEIFLADS